MLLQADPHRSTLSPQSGCSASRYQARESILRHQGPFKGSSHILHSHSFIILQHHRLGIMVHRQYTVSPGSRRFTCPLVYAVANRTLLLNSFWANVSRCVCLPRSFSPNCLSAYFPRSSQHTMLAWLISGHVASCIIVYTSKSCPGRLRSRRMVFSPLTSRRANRRFPRSRNVHRQLTTCRHGHVDPSSGRCSSRTRSSGVPLRKQSTAHGCRASTSATLPRSQHTCTSMLKQWRSRRCRYLHHSRSHRQTRMSNTRSIEQRTLSAKSSLLLLS